MSTNEEIMSDRMSAIKHKILVMSGKGGVGKSTVSSQIALSLVEQGFTVGILDIDICGPSIPRMMGVEDKKLFQSDQGWVPVFVDESKKLRVMSIGFLIGKDDAVIWRGPKKTGMVKQFMRDVFWGELDYLIIDTPPGTSDEHITVCEYIAGHNPDGVVMVTTPQGIAINDVLKEIAFCNTIDMPILGLVENMSGFVCPCCGEITNVFSKGGGEQLAQYSDIPFLGSIPLDPELNKSLEKGESLAELFPESHTVESLRTIVAPLVELETGGESKDADQEKEEVDMMKQE